jgi:hypothetical protein
MKNIIIFLTLFLSPAIAYSQAEDNPIFHPRDINYVYNWIADDLINQGGECCLDNNIFLRKMNTDTAKACLYFAATPDHLLNDPRSLFSKEGVILAYSVDLEQIDFRTQIKLEYFNLEQNESRENFTNSNCIVNFGFDHIYRSGDLYFVKVIIDSKYDGDFNMLTSMYYLFQKNEKNRLIEFKKKVFFPRDIFYNKYKLK